MNKYNSALKELKATLQTISNEYSRDAELLTDGDALLMTVLSPYEVVDKVLEYTKNLDRRSKELDNEQKSLSSSINGKGEHAEL